MQPAARDVRPFDELRTVPRPLRVPRPLALAVGGVIAGGNLLGALTHRRRPSGYRIARTIFFGSAFGYLATSLIDFWEHQRLEKEVTGHYFRWVAVPPGETVNHAATIGNVISMLIFARPLRRRPSLRDLWVLAAPGLFMALGWRDELVYHRRRTTHREDIMHTTAHLAAATMLASLYAMRLPRWGRARRLTFRRPRRRS
jgi:hypothetical protein